MSSVPKKSLNKISKSSNKKKFLSKRKSDNSYPSPVGTTKSTTPDVDQGIKRVERKPLKKILKTKKQSLLLRDSCGYITISPLSKSLKFSKNSAPCKTVTFNEKVDVNIISNDQSVTSDSEYVLQGAEKKTPLDSNAVEHTKNMKFHDIIEMEDKSTLIDILKGNPNNISNDELSRMIWPGYRYRNLQHIDSGNSSSTLSMSRLQSGQQAKHIENSIESQKEEKPKLDIKSQQLEEPEHVLSTKSDKFVDRVLPNMMPKYRYADLTPMEKEYLLPFSKTIKVQSELKKEKTKYLTSQQEAQSEENEKVTKSNKNKLSEKYVGSLQEKHKQVGFKSSAKGFNAYVTKDVTKDTTEGFIEGSTEGYTEGSIKDSAHDSTKGSAENSTEDAIVGAIGGVSEGATGGVSEGARGDVIEGTTEGISEGATGSIIKDPAEKFFKNITANVTDSTKNNANSASNVKIFSDSVIDDPLTKAHNDLVDLILMHEQLSKDYDIHFAKLRYIQHLCNEPHDACHDPLITKIMNVFDQIDNQDDSKTDDLSELEDF